MARTRPELRIVADQHCTPTYVPHLARAILFLLGDRRPAGPVGNLPRDQHRRRRRGTSLPPRSFARRECRFAIQPITTAEYGAPAARPSYSVLDTAAYHRLGGPAMPDWKAALAEYFAEWQSADRQTS